MVLDVEIYMKLIFLPKHLLRGCFNKEVNMAKKAKFKKQEAQIIEMPFGATSRKQQMILDSEAEILVIGGGV